MQNSTGRLRTYKAIGPNTYNTGLAKVAGTSSYNTFVVHQSLVLRINPANAEWGNSPLSPSPPTGSPSPPSNRFNPQQISSCLLPISHPKSLFLCINFIQGIPRTPWTAVFRKTPAQKFKRKSKLDFNYQNLQIAHLSIF